MVTTLSEKYASFRCGFLMLISALLLTEFAIKNHANASQLKMLYLRSKMTCIENLHHTAIPSQTHGNIVDYQTLMVLSPKMRLVCGRHHK